MITPNVSGTIALSANAVPLNAALPVGGGLILNVFNRGPGDAFIDCVNDANFPAAVPSGAVTGGLCIAANQPATQLRLRATDTRIAYISTSNSALYVTRCKDEQ